MKHKILPACSLFLFTCFTLHAQIEKKDILLGGTFGFGTTTSNTYNATSNAGINPRLSYAIGKNQVVGLFGSFNYGKSKSPNDSYKNRNWTYGASLFWRKYLPIQNKLGWYVEANAGISRSEYKHRGSGSISENSSFNYSVGAVPGVYYHALPRLLINAHIGGVSFIRSIDKNSMGSTEARSSYINVNFLSAFTFGVDFILNKKTS